MAVRPKEMLAREREHGEEAWYWLSFADGSRPAGEQFLGVVIVRAKGFALAHQQVGLLGISPGGEVLGGPGGPWIEPPPEYTNRLLTRRECELIEQLFMVQLKAWELSQL